MKNTTGKTQTSKAIAEKATHENESKNVIAIANPLQGAIERLQSSADGVKDNDGTGKCHNGIKIVAFSAIAYRLEERLGTEDTLEVLEGCKLFMQSKGNALKLKTGQGNKQRFELCLVDPRAMAYAVFKAESDAMDSEAKAADKIAKAALEYKAYRIAQAKAAKIAKQA